MNGKKVQFSGVGLILLSIPVVAVGARLRELSPLFPEWFNTISSSSDMDPGLGLALSTTSFFMTIAWVFGTFSFVGTLIVLSRMQIWLKAFKPVWIGTLVIISICCAWGSVILMADAIDNFRWGFTVLAGGEMLTVAGVILSIRILGPTRASGPELTGD